MTIMMIPKILVDSNILVYAINDSSPKQSLAQKFLNDNLSNLLITPQNILETLRILTHSKFPTPLTPAQAQSDLAQITDNLIMVIPTEKTLFIALELIKKHILTAKKVFDAYLAATALSNDINIIATDNVKDFKIFEDLKVMNPFEEFPAS